MGINKAWNLGVAVCVFVPAVAVAAPKTAASAGGSAPGTASTNAGAAAAPAAPTAPTAPSPTATNVAPPPADSGAPATDAAAPTPESPAVSTGEAEAEDTEEAPPPRPVRHKRKRQRRRLEQEAEDNEQPAPEEGSDASLVVDRESPDRAHWRVLETRFIISAERLTTIAGWSTTESVSAPPSTNGSSFNASNIEVSSSGTDVSFLGTGVLRNLYAIPRLGFDAVIGDGFTLGGSLSYAAQTSKSDVPTGANGSTTSEDGPTVTTFVFAPRAGFLFEASPGLAIWLRGGMTRVSQAIDNNANNTNTNLNSGTLTGETITVVAVTAEPTLVFTPVPHVGITLSGSLDIGVSGSDQTSYADNTSHSNDFKASSYGMSAGIAALF